MFPSVDDRLEVYETYVSEIGLHLGFGSGHRLRLARNGKTRHTATAFSGVAGVSEGGGDGKGRWKGDP